MENSPNSTSSVHKPFGTLFQLTCKRLFDVLTSFICLLLVSPMLIIIVVCIMVEDGRPVLFRQQRAGQHNQIFNIYKFRSMKQNDNSSSSSGTSPLLYQWENGVPDDFVFKTASLGNSRVTKTGRLLRKYSLDELPQLWNVLKGDMSMIGPRPEIIEITRCYDDTQQKRLAAKPGISGLAQVTGRNLNHGEKIKQDLYYVEHFSLWLDIKISLRTFGKVITGKDAM